MTQEVIAIENDIYVVRYGKETRGYEKSTMNLNFIIEGDKNFKFRGSRSRVLDFPLDIGKKWANQFSSMESKTGHAATERNFLEEYFASAFEEVSVLGGTFKAIRIEYKSMYFKTMKQIAKSTYWYSPEVKAIIKRVEENGRERRDIQLIAYSDAFRPVIPIHSGHP